MAVPASTRQQLNDHLGQAEFSLNVAANFECLKGTPALDNVRKAMAQVALARIYVREQLSMLSVRVRPEVAELAPGERHRVIQRRMGRLAP